MNFGSQSPLYPSTTPPINHLKPNKTLKSKDLAQQRSRPATRQPNWANPRKFKLYHNQRFQPKTKQKIANDLFAPQQTNLKKRKKERKRKDTYSTGQGREQFRSRSAISEQRLGSRRSRRRRRVREIGHEKGRKVRSGREGGKKRKEGMLFVRFVSVLYLIFPRPSPTLSRPTYQ